MATVYLAIQENFQREVALKVMSPTLSEDSSFSERFLQEARIVSRLVHPHIVTVHDVGIQNGHHFLSMEYIEGHDLKERLPSLKGEQLFRITKEVARALDYAGRKGYVHRDVKPENIMIHNSDGRAVLMDFGIARAADSVSTMTRTGTALGTPHYMSPEQARGDIVDCRSDLYSLGVLLYYMLVGRVPYEADSPVAVGIKHVSAPVPQLPEALSCYQDLIDKTMAKNPGDRYQTGSELVYALTMADIHELDRWRPTQGFEYLGSHEHTPLRSDQIDLVSGSLPLAQAAKPSPSSSNKSLSELLAKVKINIPKEDLAQRSEVRGKSQATSKKVSPMLIGLMLLVVAITVGYYVFSESSTEQAKGLAKTPSKAPAQLVKAEVDVASDTVQEVKPRAEKPVSINDEAASERVATLVDDELAVRAISNEGNNQESIRVQRSEKPVVEASGSNLQPSSTSPITTDDLAADPVAELLAKAEALNPGLEQQAETMPELLSIYRQLLLLQPGQPQAQEALAVLKQQSIDLALIQAEVGESEAAKNSVNQALDWFPELAENNDIEQLQQRLQQNTSVTPLLNQAQSYFDRDRLLRPKGSNALELYRQVLSIEEDNALAQQGIDNIVVRYGQLAESASQNHNYNQALTYIDTGLSVKTNETLLSLKEQVLAGQKQEQSFQQLLAKAESLAEQQQWFTENNSAAQIYQQLLSQQPNRQEVVEGMNSLLGLVVSEAEGLMVVKDYDQALSLISSALNFMPQHETLVELQQRLQSMGPVIDQLLVSGLPIVEGETLASDKISADRTLYIAFNFANMGKPASVLQAILFDGGRSVQIASTPVVVIGEEGGTQFRFERPVEGFTEGGYIIDILLAGERIYSNTFVIDN